MSPNKIITHVSHSRKLELLKINVHILNSKLNYQNITVG